MSGIYIPNMEIPVGHNEATFGIDADGNPLLAVYTDKNIEPEIYYIIPVPDHGRLIDADALRSTMYHEAFETDSPLQKWDSGCWIRYKMFEQMEKAAPTIIPADHFGDANEMVADKEEQT